MRRWKRTISPGGNWNCDGCGPAFSTDLAVGLKMDQTAVVVLCRQFDEISLMLNLMWDFFLSLSLRTVFTLALFGGVNFFAWAFESWQAGDWKDEPHLAQLSFLLAGVTTLVGLAGTFRRGNAEANFSVFAVAGIVAGAGLGHIHITSERAGQRTLRRFPSIESFFLGGVLIALWILMPLWKEEPWALRNGAIIGGAQILWGLTLEIFRSSMKG